MPRSRPQFLQRKTDEREPIQRILIVCEGKKTEVNYFKAFRLTNVAVHLHGIGENTVSVVEAAQSLDEKDGPYDQVWCVFDRDSFPLNLFNTAFRLADNYGFEVAYSNESFELWYCLHFNYYSTALGRQQYASTLGTLLGERYDKASGSMYQHIKDKQAVAIQNATKLLAWHDGADPASANPSTTVHLLVERLNLFIEK